MKSRTRHVPVNERGARIGEFHQRAVLSDAEVERMRDLHEAGDIGYGRLAKLFKCSKAQAQKICTYRVRNQYADRHKLVDN